MELQDFFANFDTIAQAPGGIQRLRELILDLAVRGKLVPQDPNDEPAEIDDVGAFLVLQNGYAFKSEWYELEGIRLVRCQNISHGYLRWNELKRVSIKKAEEFKRFELVQGDIVLALDRPLITTGLKVARIQEDDLPCLLLQRVARPIFKDERLSPEFFYIWLQSPAFVDSIDPGRSNGVPHISAKEVHSLQIRVPSRDEQERIVARVDELMALCDELEAKQSKRENLRDQWRASALDALMHAESDADLEQAWARIRDNWGYMTDHPDSVDALRQAILQLAVRGKLVPQDPNDEPASELLKRIAAEKARLVKEKKIRKPKALEPLDEDSIPFNVPAGWCWQRVQDIGEVKLGRQRSPKNHDGPYMVPYLRVANVHEARLDLSDVKQMNFTPEEQENFRLQPGDVLLNEGQSYELIGRPALYMGEIPGVCFQNTILRYRCYDELQSEYCLIVFRAYLHNGRFRQEAKQTTNMAHLSAGRLSTIEFPLPPLGEQKRIVAQFTEMMEMCDRLEAHLHRTYKVAEALAAAAVHHLAA